MRAADYGMRAQAVKNRCASLTTETKNELLRALAERLQVSMAEILAANEQDLAATHGLSGAMQDRLRLTAERIEVIAQSVEQIATLPDPLAVTPEKRIFTNGLTQYKVTVPFGVIAIIYEARPNVTIDAAALALKSGNAVILRGGKEAQHTNLVLTQCVRDVLHDAGVPEDIVQYVQTIDRSLVGELLRERSTIDLVIPRGGRGLIQFVLENSTVPVIETGSGICHVYVDKAADPVKATAIVMNAKTQRPSVCNALETLLVHRAVAPQWLPVIAEKLTAAGVELRGDEATCRCVSGCRPVTAEDWATEYNDLILSVKVVDDLDAALAHIARYGTRHSECIISEDKHAIERFLREVDAAAVYANASTRFTDGFEFGLGAEIGISTQKLHARGPMGLEALVTYKYCLYGTGQVRS